MPNIETIDGYDYLVTGVIKLDNQHIDANKLFIDIYEANNYFNKQFENKERPYGYAYSLSAMLRRFSGTYFSPSLMTSYMCNPALCICSNLFYEDPTSPTRIGTIFHKILEVYYTQDKSKRNRDDIYKIAALQSVADNASRNKLNKFLDGFHSSYDYLVDEELDDTNLACKTELKFNDILEVQSIGAKLPIATKGFVDRLDYRSTGNYIIDYKTGNPNKNAVTFDGYLGSMILYKWGIETCYQTPVKSGYLMAPAKKQPWMQLDFSKEAEIEMYDRVNSFYERFNRDISTNVYEFTNKGFMYSGDGKAFKQIMNNDSVNSLISLKMLLGPTLQK